MKKYRRPTKFEMNYSFARDQMEIAMYVVRMSKARAPSAQASAVALIEASAALAFVYRACSRHPVSQGVPRLAPNAKLTNRELLAVVEQAELALDVIEHDYPLDDFDDLPNVPKNLSPP